MAIQAEVERRIMFGELQSSIHLPPNTTVSAHPSAHLAAVANEAIRPGEARKKKKKKPKTEEGRRQANLAATQAQWELEDRALEVDMRIARMVTMPETNAGTESNELPRDYAHNEFDQI